MRATEFDPRDSAAWLRPVPAWLRWAEPYWHETADGRGCFGAGAGGGLGLSSTAGYLAACAALAAGPAPLRADCGWPLERLTDRARRVLRFILDRHVSQAGRTPGLAPWGHSWGAPIILERMANAVDNLDPWLAADERAAWRAVLADEADHDLTVSIETNRFGRLAETHGERNYWRGSLLFRAARLWPEHPRAADWMERSRVFCLNALSVPDDARDATVVDGRPVRERHLGANLHAGGLFEHHGTLSLDYSVIAESFFVMAMIGVLHHGWEPTASLFHHVGDVWRFIRRCLTPDGRIVCFGKQRPRYTIMYQYLLPCLVFWARYGGDAGAWDLARAVERLAETDRAASGDGSFVGARGEGLRLLRADARPFYYFRLEADAIMAHTYAWLLLTAPERRLAFGPTCGAAVESETDRERLLVSRDAGLVLRRGARALCAVYWNRSERAGTLRRLLEPVRARRGRSSPGAGRAGRARAPRRVAQQPGHGLPAAARVACPARLAGRFLRRGVPDRRPD